MTRPGPQPPNAVGEGADPRSPPRDESPWALAAAEARARDARRAAGAHDVPATERTGATAAIEAARAVGRDELALAAVANARASESASSNGSGSGIAIASGSVMASTSGSSLASASAPAPAGSSYNGAEPTSPTLGIPVRKPTWSFMFAHPAHVLGLGFGSGLSRVAPGTMGTLAAWLLFRILQPTFSDNVWAALIAASFIVGWWACTVTARHMAVADPGAIVWDEILAFWIVLWLIGPTTFVGEAVAFALFRFFDAAKPGPVAWADALFKVKRGKPIGWAQGFGIIFDDLVAALCTLLVIAIWRMW